jgi:probable HAF family extracellular repeat protein
MKKGLIITALVLAAMVATAFGNLLKYRTIDLTVLAQQSGAGIIPTGGNAINDAGMITGYGDPSVADPNAQPFLYVRSTGKFINIGNLLGFTNSYGGNSYAINQRGIVVGRDSISNTTDAYRPFLFYDANGNGNVDPCELQDLEAGAEGRAPTGATSINDFNQVVGMCSNTSLGGWVWTDKNGNMRYDDGEKQYFGSLIPYAINNAHQIVLTGDASHTALWNDSNGNGVYEDSEKQTMPYPETPAGDYITMTAVAINNNGDICFYVKKISTSYYQGFYWTDTNHNGIVEANEYIMISPPTATTYPRAMNNKGQVVGGTYMFTGNDSHARRAFIWTKDGGMVDLNDVASYVSPDPCLGPAILTQAEGINNNGIIVAGGYFDLNHNGQQTTGEPEHSFVLIPYPDGDINTDNNVNFQDFAIPASQYRRSDCMVGNKYCNGADINKDGTVNWKDIKILADNWLATINY